MPGIQAPFPKAQLSVGLGQMATLRLGNLISPAGSALSLGSPLHRYPALGLRPLTQMRKVIQGEAQHLGDLASIELPFKVGGGRGFPGLFQRRRLIQNVHKLQGSGCLHRLRLPRNVQGDTFAPTRLSSCGVGPDHLPSISSVPLWPKPQTNPFSRLIRPWPDTITWPTLSSPYTALCSLMSA